MYTLSSSTFIALVVARLVATVRDMLLLFLGSLIQPGGPKMPTSRKVFISIAVFPSILFLLASPMLTMFTGDKDVNAGVAILVVICLLSDFIFVGVALSVLQRLREHKRARATSSANSIHLADFDTERHPTQTSGTVSV